MQGINKSFDVVRRYKNERGVVLVATFIVLITLTVLLLAFSVLIRYEIKSSGAGLLDMKTLYIAEAGLAKARWAVATGTEAVGWGESDISFGDGTYTVTTADNGDSTYTITSEGYIPDDTNFLSRRRVEEKAITVSYEALTNFSLAATASASSVKGNNTADKANDGTTNTKWQANGTPSVGSPEWLAMDLRSATTFDRVIFYEPPGNQIMTYEIQYSSDTFSWSAVSSAVVTVDGNATTVDFDAVTDRYHRINITASSRRNPSISEFESYNSEEEVDMILGQGKFVTSW